MVGWVLIESLSKNTMNAIKSQIIDMHNSGVYKVSLTYGNIIIDKLGMPWFIDFENSIYSPKFLKNLFKKYILNDLKNLNLLYK